MDQLLASIWRIWRAGYVPFAEAGADTFVVATPNGNMVWSSDHAVISQLWTSHPKSGVAVDMMKFFDIWGPTLGSVEGHEWKVNRRIVTAGLGSSINSTICRGLFDMELPWDDERAAKTGTQISSNHKISFDRALMLMLKRLGTLNVTPRFLLNRLPFVSVKEASLGFNEVTNYLKELRAGAERHIEEIAKKKHKSLLESIVLSGADLELTGKNQLSDGNVMGNLFFALMAGHETTGSTLGFIFIFMAIYPEMQAKFHAQLDKQFHNRPKDEWSFERNCHALQNGYIRAFQKEVLSLYNPVSFTIRKMYEPISLVDAKGQLHHIAADTITPIAMAAANHNPALWNKPKRSEDKCTRTLNSPALFFNPDRWLNMKEIPTQGDPKAQEFPKWFAFGQGPRMCPGKAFAETEMAAVMATLFCDYSLELVVSQETLQRCGGDETKAWSETQEHAIRMLWDDIVQNITITVAHDLPIRVVRRRKE